MLTYLVVEFVNCFGVAYVDYLVGLVFTTDLSCWVSCYGCVNDCCGWMFRLLCAWVLGEFRCALINGGWA